MFSDHLLATSQTASLTARGSRSSPLVMAHYGGSSSSSSASSTDRMAQQLRALDISRPAPPHAQLPSHNGRPAIVPVMKKFMQVRQDAARDASSSAAAGSYGQQQSAPHTHAQAQSRTALLDLAGVNTARLPAAPSPPKKLALGQHTAHGAHGPAHATASRMLTSAMPAKKAVPSGIPGVSLNDVPLGIGRHEGGLEKEEREMVLRNGGGEIGEGAGGRVLEMDSSTVGGASGSGDKRWVQTPSLASYTVPDCRLTASLHSPPSLSIASFEIGRKLGRGKFGRVYLARTKAKPHFIVALKLLWKHEIVKDKVERQVRREIEIQQNLRWVALLEQTVCPDGT